MLEYITDFLIYLDTDKNKTIQANAIYSIESSNKNKNTFTETTCDNYKDENTSFWVDVQSGNTKNTILDYMNLKYSITKKLEKGEKIYQVIKQNDKIFKSLKEDTKKEKNRFFKKWTH